MTPLSAEERTRELYSYFHSDMWPQFCKRFCEMIKQAEQESAFLEADRWRAKENSCIDGLRNGLKIAEERIDKLISEKQEAYDRGFKDGDKCTEGASRVAYEAGFREAVEKAAKVVDIAYHQEPFGDDATITIADDPTKIAAAIRALMEQSK